MASTKKSAASAAKTTAAKPAAAKAAAAKTAETKPKTVRKTCKVSTNVEMAGLCVSVDSIQAAVKKAVKALNPEAADVKIYVNTNEQTAYYTVDGEGSDTYKVDLKTL